MFYKATIFALAMLSASPVAAVVVSGINGSIGQIPAGSVAKPDAQVVLVWGSFSWRGNDLLNICAADAFQMMAICKSIALAVKLTNLTLKNQEFEMFVKYSLCALAILISSPAVALTQSGKNGLPLLSKSTKQDIVSVSTRAKYVWGGSDDLVCKGCGGDNRDQ